MNTTSHTFLSDEDFYVDKGQRGQLLCVRIPNISVVLFYSTTCKFCPEAIEAFKRLPKVFPDLHVGLLNVQKSPRVTQLSKETLTPITFVPYIILFVNERPFLRYDGPKNFQDIVSFIKDILGKINMKKTFQQNGNRPLAMSGNNAVPSYDTSIPFNVVCDADRCVLTTETFNTTKATNSYCKDDGCYLDFEEAYSAPESNQNRQSNGDF